ncbi:hypothetical protein AURDEDRAFT_65432 [Auricularia subglabra TFB-10046 SS5]|nr:hypothetical protein AURDEDRAFT_65432 [Auricularia subglabra TFB-10046 SS5]
MIAVRPLLSLIARSGLNLFQDLPPGIPVLPKNDAGNFAKYHNPPPHIYVKDEAWQNCVRAMEKHDSVLCRGYREEIDTLLVFAGLFSAVVTAFSIESYQWLQNDPQEAMVMLLLQIVDSVSTNGTSATIPTNFGLSASVSARINIYWFMALSLSLSAALIGILCKQWIREFERYVGASARDIVALRQMKFDGLLNWKVGDIIGILPLLLQFSLALFALGVLELLWRLHTVVAAAVCVPTIAAVVVYLATTLLTVIQHRQYRRNTGPTLWRKLSVSLQIPPNVACIPALQPCPFLRLESPCHPVVSRVVRLARLVPRRTQGGVSSESAPAIPRTLGVTTLDCKELMERSRSSARILPGGASADVR